MKGGKCNCDATPYTARSTEHHLREEQPCLQQIQRLFRSTTKSTTRLQRAGREKTSCPKRQHNHQPVQRYHLGARGSAHRHGAPPHGFTFKHMDAHPTNDNKAHSRVNAERERERNVASPITPLIHAPASACTANLYCLQCHLCIGRTDVRCCVARSPTTVFLDELRIWVVITM